MASVSSETDSANEQAAHDYTVAHDFTVALGFSIIESEVAQFSQLAEKWWDVKGEFAPLHRFNPTRVKFIRDTALGHFGHDQAGRKAHDLQPFTGLSLLDIGCGGGLLCEPMARMGFSVTGLDASSQNIGTARAHAQTSGLEINYMAQTVEQLGVETQADFDVVLCMEVIEHVNEPRAFLQACAKMVAPNGIMIMATLNRTLKAHALAIVGAEYILGWVPRGTHDWHKFIKPSEMQDFLADTTLQCEDAIGVSYNPLTDQWLLSGDVDVNYMMVARRQ